MINTKGKITGLKSYLGKNMLVFALVIVSVAVLIVITYVLGNSSLLSQSKGDSKITVVLRSPVEVADELTTYINENDYETFVTKFDEEVKDVNIFNTKGATLLSVAVQNANIDIIQFLFSRAADVNKANAFTGETPLMVAIKKNDEYITELLIIAGSDLNATDNYGKTPILIASDVKNMLVVELLVSRGAIAGANTDNLFYYVSRKNAVGVNAMLRSGINPNVKNKQGFTPLYMAASMGEIGIVNSLVSFKANVNTRVGDGSTPLIGAARYKKANVAEVLLERGAEINVQNRKGETALYWASANNMRKTVNQLLTLNANAALKTKEGVTPYQIAQKRNYKNLISLFRKYKIYK